MWQIVLWVFGVLSQEQHKFVSVEKRFWSRRIDRANAIVMKNTFHLQGQDIQTFCRVNWMKASLLACPECTFCIAHKRYIRSHLAPIIWVTVALSLSCVATWFEQRFWTKLVDIERCRFCLFPSWVVPPWHLFPRLADWSGSSIGLGWAVASVSTKMKRWIRPSVRTKPMTTTLSSSKGSQSWTIWAWTNQRCRLQLKRGLCL